MADWKLLSFYTASSGSAHRLDAREADSLPANGDVDHGASLPPAQEVFCTGNNITSCVGFLNQELQLLGLPSVTCCSKGLPEVCSLLNRAYDLLRYYQRIFGTKEELENRIHRLSGERDHHKSVLVRSTRKHEALERSLAQETEKLRQLSSRHKVTSSKLKVEKDEVKCLQSVMHHKDLQFKHELKKKEREINKLKDRLHQMLMDKNPDRKVGMDLMNTVQNPEGRRAQWKPGLSKQEEEMYQMLVGNYEDRHRELVLENTELRDCLLTMQRELAALLKQTELPGAKGQVGKNVPDLSDSSSSSDEQFNEVDEVNNQSYLTVAELNEGYYQMPYDMVRQEIERAFKRTCQRIGLSMKRTWKQKPNGSPGGKLAGGAGSGSPGRKDGGSGEVQQMQKQLSKYKDIIQQQEQLIQHSLQTHSDSFLHESHLLHEKDVLAKEKKLFYQEKAHFEQERKLFTEAAIKLGRERKAVQEDKMKFLKEHFLSITPFKERHTASQIHHKEGGSRLLPATPQFSPAPDGRDGQTKTPNTTDLFRTLGLSELPSEGKYASTPKSTAEVAASSQPPSSPTTPTRKDVSTPTTTGLRLNLFSSPGSAVSDHSVKSDNH